MTHRLKCTIVSAALVVGICLIAGTVQAKVAWTFGGINPPNAPVTLASKKFAEWVTQRTDGRVTVNFYEASQLGSGPAQIEAMSNGAQDGYISSGSNASNLLREFGVIDMPFLFKSQKQFERFMDSDMIRGLKERLAKEFNVRIISDNWMRLPRVLMTRDGCVKGPADIAGKRTRSPNLPMFLAGWKAIGTVPVPISYGEAYMALSQGLVDMTESAGEQIFSSKNYEILPYVTFANMMYLQNSVYVAESSWQNIAPDDRTIILKTADDAGKYFTKLVADQAAGERATMEKSGVTFCDLPATGRDAFRAMVKKSVPSFEKAGLLPVGWWDKIDALK